jgi:hypothetical protein
MKITMSLSNQQYKIMMWLCENDHITTRDATRELEIYRLASRIFEIRKLGFEVWKTMIRTKGGAKVASYMLTFTGKHLKRTYNFINRGDK